MEDYDLIDYFMALDAERDMELDAAIAEERALENDARMLESIELDMEIMIMLEIA